MAAVVVITPNPAIDVTYRVAEQRVGTTQRVTEVHRAPGGKGVIVVRVLGALGVDAVSLAPLGGSAGAWMAAALDGLGVAHIDAPIAAETRSTVTVVDDVAHPTMFGEPGPAIADTEWELLGSMLVDALSGASVLVVSGSLPRGTDPEIVGQWVRLAHGLGVRSVVDVSGPALRAAADAGATILKPNLEELTEATTTTSEAAGASALLARGAGTVVVSRGADGIAAHTANGQTVTVRAVPDVAGNPTGAGDAATAGLVAALVAALVEPGPSDTRPSNATPSDTAPSNATPSDTPPSNATPSDTAPPGRVPQDAAFLRAALRRAAAAGAAAVLRPGAGEIDLAAYTRFATDHTQTPPGGPA